MDRKQEFEKLVAIGLAPFRQPVIEAMKELFRRPVPPEAKVMWFEVYSDTWGFPVSVVAMDESAINEASFRDRDESQNSSDSFPGSAWNLLESTCRRSQSTSIQLGN